MANGIGTGVYFSVNGSLTSGGAGITGSIESFTITRMSEQAEIVDGQGGFIYVGKTKVKDVIDMSIILTGSGSKFTVPHNLDAATFASPWSDDVTGSFYVTNNPKVETSVGTAAKATVQLTKYYKSDGTTL
jgi:hypothetical protein